MEGKIGLPLGKGDKNLHIYSTPSSNQAFKSALYSPETTNVGQDGSPNFATSSDSKRPEKGGKYMRAEKEILQSRLEETMKAINIDGNTQRGAVLSRRTEHADTRVPPVYMEKRSPKFRGETFRKVVEPGPIRKVSDEMLGAIFRFHVENDLSPWILVRVCKRWMNVAMVTPQLWCYLFILKFPDEGNRYGQIQSYAMNGRVEHSLGRMQVCANQQQVQAAIDRSGATLPLSIKIASWYPNRITTSILVRFLSHPLSERIGNLDIGQLRFKDPISEGIISIGSFPLLRSLQIPGSMSPCIERLLESVSTTSMALERFTFRSGFYPLAAASSLWPRLKCIVVGGESSHLNKLVHHFGDIEHMDGDVTEWPNLDTPTSTLRNLQSIRLDCSPQYLGRLQLPQLKALCFHTTKHYPLDRLSTFGQLSYPKLVNLDVYTRDPNWHTYTVGAFPAVENFILNWDGDDFMLIKTLKGMPRVRNVKGQCSSWAFGILLMRALSSLDEPVLCPNLERLSLGDAVQTPKPELTARIKLVTEFRNKAGRPLKELTIHWNSGPVDYAVNSLGSQ